MRAGLVFVLCGRLSLTSSFLGSVGRYVASDVLLLFWYIFKVFGHVAGCEGKDLVAFQSPGLSLVCMYNSFGLRPWFLKAVRGGFARQTGFWFVACLCAPVVVRMRVLWLRGRSSAEK